MECFLSESKANEFIQREKREKGRLVTVPAFESKHDAEKWIQEQDTQDCWYVSSFDNSILVDSNGNPLEEQTTRRNPGEPIARVRSLGKPDYIYCVEPN